MTLIHQHRGPPSDIAGIPVLTYHAAAQSPAENRHKFIRFLSRLSKVCTLLVQLVDGSLLLYYLITKTDEVEPGC